MFVYIRDIFVRDRRPPPTPTKQLPLRLLIPSVAALPEVSSRRCVLRTFCGIVLGHSNIINFNLNRHKIAMKNIC